MTHYGGAALPLSHTGALITRDSAIHNTLRKCTEEVIEMSRLRVIRELWQLMNCNKKYWLAPIITVLVLVGFLLVVAASSALAPFIYTLF